MNKLEEFLKENNFEIVTKLEVANSDVFNSIKPSIVNLVLSCLKTSYEVKEIVKTN